MSKLLDDHPRYRPCNPTAEQFRKMHELLGKLSRGSDQAVGDVSPPLVADDLAANP